jgi:hypothetical protein
MLTYSPRERFWVWEIDEIRDEGITPNVLDLLGAKMTACSSGLRVGVHHHVSCSVATSIPHILPKLFGLRLHLKLRHVSEFEWTKQ